jgi:hypothetical protein
MNEFDEKVLEEWLAVLINGQQVIESAEYRPAGNEKLEKYLGQREEILNELVKLVQSGENRHRTNCRSIIILHMCNR